MPTRILLGSVVLMRIIIASSGVGYLREAKMRLNNKSHLLKTGLTTIQRNYSIINLLKSFYRLANLNLKFGFYSFLLSNNTLIDFFIFLVKRLQSYHSIRSYYSISFENIKRLLDKKIIFPCINL